MPVSERCVQLALLWPSQQHDDPALPKLKIKRCFTLRKEMKINLQCKIQDDQNLYIPKQECSSTTCVESCRICLDFPKVLHQLHEGNTSNTRPNSDAKLRLCGVVFDVNSELILAKLCQAAHWRLPLSQAEEHMCLHAATLHTPCTATNRRSTPGKTQLLNNC